MFAAFGGAEREGCALCDRYMTLYPEGKRNATKAMSVYLHSKNATTASRVNFELTVPNHSKPDKKKINGQHRTASQSPPEMFLGQVSSLLLRSQMKAMDGLVY